MAIASIEKKWTAYPVLRLDLSAGDMTEPDNLKSHLNNCISYWEDKYGKRETETTLADRFKGIIRRAYKQTGYGTVILIDEYDNPLFSTLGNPNTHEQMRTMLKGLYSVLKSESEHVHFCFLTGITRFSKMSVFSGLNNLQDLTLKSQYAAICGITQHELETYCTEGIKTVAQVNGWDCQTALESLKTMYDGYHFAAVSPDIYNPFSLLQALQDGELLHYWNYSGGGTELLWRQIMTLGDDKALLDVLSPVVELYGLGISSDGSQSLESLLFQTGYLTIKGASDDGEYFRLGLPNREVEKGMMRGLLPLAARRRTTDLNADILHLKSYADNGRIDEMMSYLRSFLAGVSNRLTKKMPEIYYENNLFILFKLIGIRVSVEVETSDGRMDVLMECRHYTYIIELKLDHSAEAALEQIRHKRYILPFERYHLPVIMLGINFSSQTRNIESWKWERIDV
ncbi:MAG: ATP-binding protein [Muribaculaceae bacterium]|nr:ATP-binding protein [Muribaculaceae bacterium]